MRTIIFVLSMLITGCATTIPVIPDLPKVQAPISIMESCKDYVRPLDGSIGSITHALVENKQVYENCNKQNEGKKTFILDLR